MKAIALLAPGLLLHGARAADGYLYGIDVAPVVCNNTPVAIELTQPSGSMMTYWHPVFFRTSGAGVRLTLSLGTNQADSVTLPGHCPMECATGPGHYGLCGFKEGQKVTCEAGLYCHSEYGTCHTWPAVNPTTTMYDNDAMQGCSNPCVYPKVMAGDIMPYRHTPLEDFGGRRLFETAVQKVRSVLFGQKAWSAPAPPAIATDANIASRSSSDDAPGAEQSSEAPQSPQLLCEEFFLLDGRTPIDLPDSWLEARQAFLSVCEDAGSPKEDCDKVHNDVFAGYPDTADIFSPEPVLCDRLMAWASTTYEPAALKPRRLKSSGGGGRFVGQSGGAVGSGYAVAGTTSYVGFSSSRLGSTYRPGYRTTAVGFAGVAATSSFFMFGGLRYRGGRHYQSNCNVNDECEVSLGEKETMFRDDIFEFAKIPGQKTWPQYLNIYNVVGKNFDPVTYCEGWQNGQNVSWVPPPGTGLFFAFSESEKLEWEEDDVAGMIVGIVFAVLFCMCFSACCFFKIKRMATAKNEPEMVEEQMEGPGPEVYGSHNPTVVQGTVVQGIPVDDNNAYGTPGKTE